MPAPFSYKNDSDEDNRAAPEEEARRRAQQLQEQEQQSGYDRDFNDMTSSENYGRDGKSGDTNDVRDQEESGGWANNTSSYEGNKSRTGKGISKGNFKAIMKKRGPLAAIIALVLGGGVGAGIFFAPSLLLVQIQESFLDKFDTQQTSMTIRTNKLLVNKIVGDSTSGSCDIVKVACRFSRPSNKLLSRLEDSGVEAFDKNGDKISKTGLFQTDRPVKYTFKGKDIDAKNFASELRTNNEFRAAFHRAYNPIFVGFTDSVFGAVKKLNGFDTSNREAESSGDSKKALNEASSGENKVGSATGDSAESKSALNGLLKDEAGKVLSTIASGGKGDAVGLVAAGVCTVADIPKLVTSTVRTYQRTLLIRYAAQFLVAGSALKAGTITSEQASTFGSLLTTSVNNKSAMDSFGMKYAMYGTTSGASNTASYQKFVPGASANNALGGVLGRASSVLSSDAKKNACQVATNPATGQAINVALAASAPATLGTSLIVAGINIAGGLVLSALVDKVVTPVVEDLLSNINFEPLLKYFVGDLTQNLEGQDVGDALTSGANNMMAETASMGGNMPLSVDDAVAYNDTAQQVQVAYADEDRATHSPLDATNSNTLVGSFVSKLVPYFADMNSVSTTLQSLASIPFGSLSTLFGNVSAQAASGSEYTLCNDPNITDTTSGSKQAAATPFCAPVYGIPTQYLDMDPQYIVDTLTNENQIDANTGDPVEGSDLKKWVDVCTQADVDQANNCQITNEKEAMYSLYVIDHRIQKTMDGQDETDDTNTTTSDTAGATIDQAHIYDDSTGVACAPGTNDAGTTQGYYNGNEINIRVCTIPNTIDWNHQDGLVKVNSRISGAALALIKGLTASSANGGKTTLKVADSFRTMAEQQAAFATYGSSRAARPGFSNHQMGLAIDFQLGSNTGVTRPGDPVYDWLAANAKTYGFAKLSSESWHWQASAAQGSAAS